MKKVMVVLLCTILAFTPMTFNTYAEEVNIESETETVTTELPETVEAVQATEIENTASETGATETEEQTWAETEALMTEESDVAETHTITGFVPFSNDEKRVDCSYEDKPSAAELVSYLPKTLKVYLDGENTAQEIPVTWESSADFDQTSFFYYEFDPVWDETVYSINTNEEVPYIGVYLYTIQTTSVSGTDNESRIFEYLVEDIGLNYAAATGVLANIFCESSFRHDVYSDNGTSYGICQWHDGSDVKRFTALKKYSSNWQTLEGQLAYLKYELSNDYPALLNKLKCVGNDAQGAYDAAYAWCYDFERPANYQQVSVTRGKLARDTYWPYYGDARAVMSNARVPSTISQGSSFSISGNIASSKSITYVSVGVYDEAGQQKTGGTARPNQNNYSLSNLDNQVKFGTLSPGLYHYKVIAQTTVQYVLIDQIFAVLSKESTITDGIYAIQSMVDSGYALSVKDDSNMTGVNIHLWKYFDSDYMKFRLIYQSGGYYKIQNVGSGQYLNASGTTSGAVVNQTAGGTLWQVLPDGKGSYSIIPKTSTTMSLDLKSGQVSKGQRVQIYQMNMSKAQKWKLSKINQSEKARIINQNYPTSIKEGSSFSIKGTIQSDTKLTSVVVGVYGADGKVKLSKSASPNATSYDLKNLDSYIKFGTLNAGVYKYRVTAKNSAGENVLIDKAFAVLSNGATVSNGTYAIASLVDSSYVLSVAGDSTASGANIHLWKNFNTNYMKFKLVYQSEGYYKIQNVGSGQYLGVAGQSSSSGANVEQSKVGTLWQVLPDGSGAYYFVPKTVATASLDLTGGQVAKGKNVQIYASNLSKAQRWKLMRVATQEKPSIKNANSPTTLTQGSSFSIKGTIQSDSEIKSVVVSVSDTSGKIRISRSAAPNTKSYELKNLDSQIKFGTLSAGIYTYKVIAKNSAGEETLVNKIFTVLNTVTTIEDGIYNIASLVNSEYVLSIQNDSSSNGANVHLWKKMNNNYMKFRFVNQGNGYYKIQNVGSGKYLTVKGQSSASGANVEQSSTAMLWQVISDGAGAYYLVPKTSGVVGLDLSGGQVAKGKNIQIYNLNMTKAQRWMLVKVING